MYLNIEVNNQYSPHETKTVEFQFSYPNSLYSSVFCVNLMNRLFIDYGCICLGYCILKSFKITLYKLSREGAWQGLLTASYHNNRRIYQTSDKILLSFPLVISLRCGFSSHPVSTDKYWWAYLMWDTWVWAAEFLDEDERGCQVICFTYIYVCPPIEKLQ